MQEVKSIYSGVKNRRVKAVKELPILEGFQRS